MIANGKLPWFPFDVELFLGSRTVQAMTTKQVGIYVLLLADEWRSGPLPTNGERLALIAKADIREVRRVLRMCFKKSAGGWINETLEGIRRAQQEKHKRRVAAGRKGGKTKRDKENHSNA